MGRGEPATVEPELDAPLWRLGCQKEEMPTGIFSLEAVNYQIDSGDYFGSTCQPDRSCSIDQKWH